MTFRPLIKPRNKISPSCSTWQKILDLRQNDADEKDPQTHNIFRNIAHLSWKSWCCSCWLFVKMLTKRISMMRKMTPKLTMRTNIFFRNIAHLCWKSWCCSCESWSWTRRTITFLPREPSHREPTLDHLFHRRYIIWLKYSYNHINY